jgi:hypothetical protein
MIITLVSNSGDPRFKARLDDLLVFLSSSCEVLQEYLTLGCSQIFSCPTQLIISNHHIIRLYIILGIDSSVK